MKATAGWMTGAGVAAVAAAAAVYAMTAGRPEPAPAAALLTAPAGAAAVAADEGPAAVITDFRAEPDGMVVVAGRAGPGGDLAIRVDGAEVARVAVGGDGQFAQVLMLPAAASPRSLDLVTDPDGQAEAGEQVFLLAPSAATQAQDAAAPGPFAEDAEPTAPGGGGADSAPLALAPLSVEGPALTAPGAPGALAPDAAQGAVANPQPAPLQALAPQTGPAPGATPAPALVLSPEGVGLAQAADAPDAPAAVALDVIAYDPGGEVRLSGRAPGEGHVRIYLDNDPRAVTPIVDGGWGVDLPGVAPGVYTLRADQIDGEGRVTSRIESPFLREPQENLAASLPAPEAGAAMRVVQPGHSLWAIARDRYGEGVLYVEVFAANRDRIRNPDLIYPGQIFVLPDLDQ